MSLLLPVTAASAEVAYFALDNVFFRKVVNDIPTNDFQQLHGYFSWTYTAGDFENGEGEFLYLGIPETDHDHTDLLTTIETGSLEITLEGNAHDAGLDISLKFLTPLSLTAAADINTALGGFDLGGNGFYAGTIYSGSVVPFDFSLMIERLASNSVRVTWTPNYTWCTLQESPTLAPSDWANASNRSPLNVTTTAPKMFYKLVLP